MSSSQKLLIAGGLALAIFGMIYGLWYAIYDEHQTLERMGVSLATSFADAATNDLEASGAALEDYRVTAAEYDREVHAHAHWITFGFLWIVIGLAWHRVALPEKSRMLLATALILGSFAFPMGVFLESYMPGAFASALAYLGSAAVLIGMGVITLGFFRANRESGAEVDTP